MNALFEKTQKVVSYVPPVEVCDDRDNLHSTEPSQILFLDPNVSQTKSRKKDVKGKGGSIHSERLKSSIELALSKKKRKCNLCKNSRNDKRTCPSNPMSKVNKVSEFQYYFDLNVII